MIINIRGTGGSGKSTLVRRVMERYPEKITMAVSDLPLKLEERQTRKRPFGYIMDRPEGGNPLWVPGHYEIACGGCDTIQKVDDVYTTVRHFAGLGYDVLFEGIMVMDDVKRAIETANTYPFLVIALTTPIEDCLAAIQERRTAKGNNEPLDPKNTRGRAERLVKSMLPRLKDSKVEVLRQDREEAFKTVCERLVI